MSEPDLGLSGTVTDSSTVNASQVTEMTITQPKIPMWSVWPGGLSTQEKTQPGLSSGSSCLSCGVATGLKQHLKVCNKHVLGAEAPAIERLSLAMVSPEVSKATPSQRGATASGHGAPWPAHSLTPPLPLVASGELLRPLVPAPLSELVMLTPRSQPGVHEMTQPAGVC